MKQSFITKFFNLILMVLGFATTSCSDLSPCMYGTPTMDYEVSGKVVNKNSVPIAGIKVSPTFMCMYGTLPVEYEVSGKVVSKGSATDLYEPDSVLTGKDGSFFISVNGYTSRKDVLLRFEDVDGSENGGEYAVKEESITLEQVEKGDGWYEGKYEAKGVVIEMEEKK